MSPPPEPPLEGQLHPAAIFLAPLRQVGPLLVVVLTGQLASGLPGRFAGFAIGFGVVAVAAVLMLAAGFLRWLRFRWGVAGGALVITEGLFERKRRVIPLDRIQAVDLARPLRHRLLGVVEVRVEAVGGSGDTEGRIDALDVATAERLRTALLRRSPGGDVAAAGEAAAALEPPLAAVSPRQLVIAGVTGGRVGVAAALVGFAYQLLGDRVEDFMTAAPSAVERIGFLGGLAIGIGVVAVVFVISVIATALAFWGFELRRDGAVLTVRRGLLDQRFGTVPLRRIQAISVDENLIRRAFGLASVRVVVAGRAGGEEGQQTAVLLPIGSRSEAFALVEAVLGLPGLTSAPIHPMPPAALARRLRQAVIGALAATVPPLIAFRMVNAFDVPPATGWRVVALTGVIVLGLLLPLAFASYRALGHGEHLGHVLARAGALVRSTTVVPAGKLQSVGLIQGPFQRRLGLATLALHLPAATSPALRDLEAAQAARWQRQLLVVGEGFEPS